MPEGAFAYSAAAVVCSDGKELLVHEPKDESPAWKKTLGEDIVDVAIAGAEIIALDEGGDLTRWKLKTGDEAGETMIDGEPRALAVSRDGKCAVMTDEGVVLLHGDERKTIAAKGARSGAFGGKLLAVGTDAGKLLVFDGDATVTEVDIGSTVRGVTRHPKGFWLVTAGDKIFRVGDDGESSTVTRATDRTPSAITCSADGSMIGVKLDTKTAVVLAYPSKDTILSVIYMERTAVKIAFADDGQFVWVGMDKGDANKIDLDNGDVYRTDPHPGRTRNSWLLSAAAEKGARLKAKAAAAAPVPAKVEQPKKETPDDTAAGEGGEARKPTPRPVDPSLLPGSESHRNIVLGVFVISAALALLSLKCG